VNTDTTFAPTTKLITDDDSGSCLYAGILRTITVPAVEELITETARKLARRIPGVTFHLNESDHLRTDGTDPMWCSAHRKVDCDRRTDGFEVDWDSIGFLAPVDRKPENVGWLRGALVLLDYDMSWNDCVACRRFGFTVDG